MSQRQCSGFNWPCLPVVAGEPLAPVPEASLAWFPRRQFSCPRLRLVPTFALKLSNVVTVPQDASLAWSLSQPVSPCSALCDG